MTTTHLFPDAGETALNALDTAAWSRANTEGWPSLPDDPQLPAPARVAPQVALAAPGRVVDMQAWRERAGGRSAGRAAGTS